MQTRMNGALTESEGRTSTLIGLIADANDCSAAARGLTVSSHAQAIRPR